MRGNEVRGFVELDMEEMALIAATLSECYGRLRGRFDIALKARLLADSAFVDMGDIRYTRLVEKLEKSIEAELATLDPDAA